MKIGILGLWHLGEIYSACLAELGHKVIGFSKDRQVIRALRKNKPPLPEPKLASLLKKHQKKGNLFYTSDFSFLRQCDVFWLTFDIPINEKDKADFRELFDGLKHSLPYLKKKVLIIVSSQLEVGTSERIRQFIRKKRKELDFKYVYIPENLRLGEGVRSFSNPSRIVIGTGEKDVHKTVKRIFSRLGKIEFLPMSEVSAEMVKHALNSFLAASLSFIYDIADLCEKVGADISDVARALRSDPRIGPKAYLDASIGFSGGTLGRDLQFLSSIAKRHKIKIPVIEAVFRKNKHRRKILFQKLRHSLGNLKGAKIAILGLTYKAGTSTLRRSLALDIVRDLSKMGAQLNLHDPWIDKKELRKTLESIKFRFGRDPYDAAKSAQALIVITPWKELTKLDFGKLYKQMEKPAIFFDVRNFFRKEEYEIKSSGFNYIGVGR